MATPNRKNASESAQKSTSPSSIDPSPLPSPSSKTAPSPSFKVLILGAGPMGLCLAHALTLASIPFTVLERRTHAQLLGDDGDRGASLVLSAASMRVMQQFGILYSLLDTVQGAKGCQIETNTVFGGDDGRIIAGVCRSPLVFKECHGTGPLSFHRADLLRHIYAGLPNESKSRILLGQQVVDIESLDHDHDRKGDTLGNNGSSVGAGGIRVTCADGTVHTGDVLIGADGVNSLARRIMQRMALETKDHHHRHRRDSSGNQPRSQQHKGDNTNKTPGVRNTTATTITAANTRASSQEDLDHPFVATYKCLWASLPNLDGRQGYASDTRSRGRSTMYIGGADRSWIFLYERLPRKTRDPGVRYTEEDMRAMADAFAGFRLTEGGGMIVDDQNRRAGGDGEGKNEARGNIGGGGLTVKQALAHATNMGMSNLDEGIAKNWSSGRIVLVGDACHKFTPNAGQGFNTGLQDVVALCNLLRRALERHREVNVKGPDDQQRLPLSTLTGLFEQYHDSRRDDVAALLQVSSTYTRIHAMASIKCRVLGRLMKSESIQRYLITRLVSPSLAKALIIDYVPFEDHYVGSIPWAMTYRAK